MTMTMGLTPSHWTATLAQTVRTTSPNAPTWNIVIAVVLLIVATALLGMVIMALRKRLLAKDDEALHPAGTMEQFRRMHANGEITDQQFEAAKQRFKAKVQKHLQDSPPKRPPVRKAREAAAGGAGGQSQPASPGAAGTGPGATGSGGQGTNPPNAGRAPAARPPLPGERRAAPGFDLTGAPLPNQAPPPPPGKPPRNTPDTPPPPPPAPPPPPTT